MKVYFVLCVCFFWEQIAQGLRASFSLSSYHDKCFKSLRERERKKKLTPEIASQSQQKTQQSRWKYISCKWKLWWSSQRRRVVQWWNGLEIRMLSNLLPLFEQLTMACFDWVCLEIAYPNFINLCWWGMLWDSTFQFGAI